MKSIGMGLESLISSTFQERWSMTIWRMTTLFGLLYATWYLDFDQLQVSSGKKMQKFTNIVDKPKPPFPLEGGIMLLDMPGSELSYNV